MSRLEHALLSIARFLEEHHIPYMVIGGLSNFVWGDPRTTLDIDLTVWVSEENLSEMIKQITKAFRSRPADPVAFVDQTHVLPLETSDGVRIDVIFGQLPYEREAIQRAVKEKVLGIDVSICRPEDLILHKLTSERLKDREDVRGVIRQQGSKLDRKYLDQRVKSLARDLDRPDIEDWYRQCLKQSGKK